MSPAESDKIREAYLSERTRLLGFIRRRVPVGVEAEDILQDVFYQLTVGFRDLDRIRNLTAWIYRVTENRIVDQFRKSRKGDLSYDDNGKESEEGSLTLAEILPSIGSTPEEEELKELIWERINDTLDELPPEQREVFIATEFEDMSFRELSEKTGTGISTLLSRKRYAVLELRKQLQELYQLFKIK
ncbi:MAG: RNA polymerase sigma factor [Bacteroidales bacterium]